MSQENTFFPSPSGHSKAKNSSREGKSLLIMFSKIARSKVLSIFRASVLVRRLEKLVILDSLSFLSAARKPAVFELFLYGWDSSKFKKIFRAWKQLVRRLLTLLSHRSAGKNLEVIKNARYQDSAPLSDVITRRLLEKKALELDFAISTQPRPVLSPSNKQKLHSWLFVDKTFAEGRKLFAETSWTLSLNVDFSLEHRKLFDQFSFEQMRGGICLMPIDFFLPIFV